MSIIEVNHVTKEYKLGAMQGLKQKTLKTAGVLTGKKAEERHLFKARMDAFQNVALRGEPLAAMAPGMILIAIFLPLSYTFFTRAESYFADVI